METEKRLERLDGSPNKSDDTKCSLNKKAEPKTAESLTVLAMDPGKVNFAWVFWQEGIQEYGWLKTMVDVNTDTDFVNGYIELLARLNPDYIVLERFMVRNRGQSIHAEIINQMIGRISILSRTYSGRDVIQITAAQWKNWWNKQKKQNWEEVYSALDSIHQRDAAGIAHYTEETWIPKHCLR